MKKPFHPSRVAATQLCSRTIPAKEGPNTIPTQPWKKNLNWSLEKEVANLPIYWCEEALCLLPHFGRPKDEPLNGVHQWGDLKRNQYQKAWERLKAKTFVDLFCSSAFLHCNNLLTGKVWNQDFEEVEKADEGSLKRWGWACLRFTPSHWQFWLHYVEDFVDQFRDGYSLNLKNKPEPQINLGILGLLPKVLCGGMNHRPTPMAHSLSLQFSRYMLRLLMFEIKDSNILHFKEKSFKSINSAVPERYKERKKLN